MENTHTISNGTVPATNTGSASRKIRSRRNFPSLPSATGATDMADVNYCCKVDNSPTAWEALALYSPFSLSADGSYPHVKVSRSKAVDVRTGKSIGVGSGRCYRVIF